MEGPQLSMLFAFIEESMEGMITHLRAPTIRFNRAQGSGLVLQANTRDILPISTREWTHGA
jgi:hypothetical protein